MSKRASSRPGPYLLQLQLMRDRIQKSDRYPYNLPLLRTLDFLSFDPKVTFLVGENGSGKSTLLEAIAIECGLNPEGGSPHFNFSTRASHSDLSECIRLIRAPSLPRDSYFLRAETFYNVASEIERLDKDEAESSIRLPPILSTYGGNSLHEQSHGESFFSLFENRIGGNGLYLMDEPEAALSPTRQLHFLVLLHDFVRRGAQFVIATHSPIIMAYPNATIYTLSVDGIKTTQYAETEHYLVTRRFLNAPQRFLHELLSEGESKE